MVQYINFELIVFYYLLLQNHPNLMIVKHKTSARKFVSKQNLDFDLSISDLHHLSLRYRRQFVEFNFLEFEILIGFLKITFVLDIYLFRRSI